MNFRFIVIVLSALALMTSFITGYFYYSSLKHSATAIAHQHAGATLQEINGHISAFVFEQSKPVKILASMREAREFIREPNAKNLDTVNNILDQFDHAMDGSICFIMDPKGTIIASSNRSGKDHVVGANYSFRPYFQDALKGEPSIFLGFVTELDSRAVFNSYPIRNESGDSIIGVAVIRTTTDQFRQQILQTDKEIVMVVSPQGLIYLASDPEWKFKTFDQLSQDQEQAIISSRQFGKGPFLWSGLTQKDADLVTDLSGNQYLSEKLTLSSVPGGWNLFYLRDLKSLYKEVSEPFFSLTAYPIIPLGLFVVVTVIIVYVKASRDIFKAQLAELKLHESEQKLRSLYDRTPGMFMTLSPDFKIIYPNHHCLKMLGFKREEMTGKDLTEFLTEDSRRHFNDVVIKDLIAQGEVSSFIRLFKKDGAILDVQFCSTSERDGLGIIFRYPAVLEDITRLKQFEAELHNCRNQLKLCTDKPPTLQSN